MSATLPPYAEGLDRLDVEEMLKTEDREMPWVVEPLCARGCLTLLVAKQGSGKSMLTQALAYGVASGEETAA